MPGSPTVAPSPDDFGRHVAEPVLRGVVGENHPEEDGPFTAPVLADLVADMYRIRRETPLDCVNRRLNLGLLRDRGGQLHPPIPAYGFSRRSPSPTLRFCTIEVLSMIARYTRPAMGAIWSEQHKYECWLETELAASEALAELGEVPAEAARSLRANASFDLDRIQEIEREVRHDVIAFTTAVAESMQAKGAAGFSRWLHYGLTSNDVVDTAQALQFKDASALIKEGLSSLSDALKKLAFEHKDAVQIGRTHGMHAEPITFGLKAALWWDEIRRHRTRFAAASEEMRVGKISGAVGTFAHIGPEAEERICARLGLKAAPITSQVLSRDLHANYIATLAGIASSLDKIALEIRHLQRTEVREAEEPFASGQKGSSAMPHKRNPIVCEQICGLARVVRANSQAAYENVALWHERDISHSSVERIVLPDSTILIDYLLSKTIWLISGLRVNAQRMARNLNSTKGLIFSGQLLLDLAAAGMLREDAYRLVQAYAMQSWENETDFRAAVASDPQISSYLTAEQLDHTFSLDRQLKNVNAIFLRVFSQ
jgi:adenylosuccinate lyase